MIQSQTSHRSRVNHLAGQSAEYTVAHWYQRHGGRVDEARWRGKGGEIDMIVQDGDDLVFVEVKKSRNFHRAAQSLSRRQMNRIVVAAGEYLDTQPLGSLTPSRFDVALVDDAGRIEVLKNAFGAF